MPTSDRTSQSGRLLSPITIGLLTGLAHFGVSIRLLVTGSNWSNVVGLPAIPAAIALLEAWDPPWANDVGGDPAAGWLFLIAMFGSNFLVYAAVGWMVASWLRRPKTDSTRSSVTRA